MKRIDRLGRYWLLLFLLCVLAGFLGAPALADTVKLPRTGQTQCFDDRGKKIDCADTGQDGDIQAGVIWPSPRFTPNSDDTMTDNLTGLVWTRDGGSPGASCRPEGKRLMTVPQALTYIRCLNTTSYLGHEDWRLPNVIEMESLNNAGADSLAAWLEQQGFVHVYLIYWTSTSDEYNKQSEWITTMQGYVGTTDKLDKNNVWPVRGETKKPALLWKTGQTKCYDELGQTITCAGTGLDGELQAGVAWPVRRFTIQGDGAVLDNLTHLEWTRYTHTPGPGSCNPGGQLTWLEALDYVKCLNGAGYLGHSDWRLPNRKELLSLVDFSRHHPALPSGHPFADMQIGAEYWTSDTYYECEGYQNAYAFEWYMVEGNSGGMNKGEGTFDYAWPVRGGDTGKIIDGLCGPSNGGTFTSVPTTGLCSSGDATKVTGKGPWRWTCLGSNGGSDASCMAEKANLPLITALSPSSGTIGATVIIKGRYFGSSQDTSTVSFNGLSPAISSWSDTAIGCAVPAGATTGPVTVTTSTGTSKGKTFTVKPPAITSLSPSSGKVGATVIVKGKFFGPSQGASTVSFNGVQATVSAWSDTVITCAAPAGATTGPVTVTTPAGTSKGKKFTVKS